VLSCSNWNYQSFHLLPISFSHYYHSQEVYPPIGKQGYQLSNSHKNLKGFLFSTVEKTLKKIKSLKFL
jgi:hypothetical protein